MKKVFLLAAIVGLLTFLSCKKSGTDDEKNGDPAENSFTVNGKEYKITSTSVINEEGLQGTGYLNNVPFGITINFYDQLPTVSGTFNIVNNLTNTSQMRVYITTNGAAEVFSITDTDTQTGTVTVNSGKINVKFSNITLKSSSGSIVAAANVTQP